LYRVELRGLASGGDDGLWIMSADELDVLDAHGGPVVAESEPSNRGARKDQGVRFDLLPAVPIWMLAELYTAGARKYDDHNWRQGREVSSWLAALQRHLWRFQMGEDIDPETGCHHLTSVMFHCCAILEQSVTRPDLDDRYQDGARVTVERIKSFVTREA
jgi:hypothetical protein